METAPRSGRRLVLVGAHGPETAKQLWRLLYDRMTNVHGIDNLIRIWNSESPDWR